jgi:hypothetical protein
LTDVHENKQPAGLPKRMMRKGLTIFQFVLTAFGGLLLTCKQPCNRLQDMNHGEPLSEYNIKNTLNDTCWNGQPKVRKRIDFRLVHWNACNLDSFDVNIILDYGIVYSGKNHNGISVEIDLCKKHPYDLQIIIIDKREGVYYRWQNKSAYVMTEEDFRGFNLVIYPQRKFDYANGKQYEIDLLYN